MTKKGVFLVGTVLLGPFTYESKQRVLRVASELSRDKKNPKVRVRYGLPNIETDDG